MVTEPLIPGLEMLHGVMSSGSSVWWQDTGSVLVLITLFKMLKYDYLILIVIVIMLNNYTVTSYWISLDIRFFYVIYTTVTQAHLFACTAEEYFTVCITLSFNLCSLHEIKFLAVVCYIETALARESVVMTTCSTIQLWLLQELFSLMMQKETIYAYIVSDVN